MNQFQLIVLLEVMAQVLLPNLAEQTIQVCGDDLREAVLQFCGDRGLYSPGEGYSFSTTSTRKGIATLCCESRCPISTLDKYCNKAPTARPETTEATAPARVTPNTSRTSQPTESSNTSSNDTIERDDSERELAELKEERDDTSPLDKGKDNQETNRPRKPTSVPHHRGHSRERKNRTSKGSSRRANNTRRRGGSNERRTLSSEKREARLRKKEQRLTRKHSNTRKKTRPENKRRVNPVTTPVAAENAEKHIKSGSYNSTSVNRSAANATDLDTAPSVDTKKGGFLTTITAVLRDKMGLTKLSHAEDENR